MNWSAKITSLGFLLLCLLNSCGNNDAASPYDAILEQPAFAGISDSIRKNPTNDELYFRRAVLLNKNNFPEPALVDFEKAWSFKKDERYAYAIASLRTEKKPDSAILFLHQALQELPESFLLRLSLARAYDATGKTDDALNVCDVILQKNPQQADVLVLKSDLLDKKGDSAQSIAVLEQAYRLVPFDPELNFNLAYKYAQSKNARVIALCDSLARADSLGIQAEPYYFKGIYYSNINDKAKAISLFNEAITHDYTFLNAYIEKSRALYDQQKFTEAYKTANLAMSISPKFADAYYWMAKSQEALGQPQEARLNYQRAYGLDKTFVEAREAADRLGK